MIIENLTTPISDELARLLMLWCDVYVIRADVKGSAMKIRPKTIIITSIYTIAECFPQWYARTMEGRFPRQVHLPGPISA